MAHLIVLITYHGPEVPLVSQLYGFDAEARGKNSVERCRRTPALEMAEHTTTRFLSRLFCDFACDNVADPAEPKFTAFDVAFDLLTVFGSRTFGNNHHSAKVTGCLARFDHAGDLLVVEWNFGNQENIGPARDAAV